MITKPQERPSDAGRAAGRRAAALAAARRLADGMLNRARVLTRRRSVRIVAATLFLLGLALAGTGWDFRSVPAPAADITVSPAPKPATKEAARLLAEERRLEAALKRRVPRGPWIVIDQTHNRLRVMKGDDLVLEAPCSAGSGMVL